MLPFPLTLIASESRARQPLNVDMDSCDANVGNRSRNGLSTGYCTRNGIVPLDGRGPVFRSTVLLTAVIFLGCGEGSQGTSKAMVRDSAGVRIVEYPATPVPEGTVSLSTEPLYKHGNRPSDYLFERVWVGALEPDGSALIADGGSQEIVHLSPDGSSFTVFARSGQGPEEVLRVMGLFVLGQDSVLVEDDGNGRFAVLEDGSLSRTVSMRGDRSIVMGLRTYGLTEAGDLLMGTSSFRSGFPDPWLPGRLVRLNLDSWTIDTIGTYDMAQFIPPGQQNPFAPNGKVGAAHGRFIVARSDIPQIRWIDGDGTLVQVVRWNPEPRFPTERDFDLFVGMLRADLRRVNPQLGSQDLEGLISEQVAQYQLYPDVPLPFFMTLQGDDQGRVWLGDYDPRWTNAGVPGYTIIGPDGRWLGSIKSPDRFRLLDVAGDLALGVVKDEFDVEQVVVYQLREG